MRDRLPLDGQRQDRTVRTNAVVRMIQDNGTTGNTKHMTRVIDQFDGKTCFRMTASQFVLHTDSSTIERS